MANRESGGRPVAIVTTALLHGWLDRPIASSPDGHAAAGIDWHGQPQHGYAPPMHAQPLKFGRHGA